MTRAKTERLRDPRKKPSARSETLTHDNAAAAEVLMSMNFFPMQRIGFNHAHQHSLDMHHLFFSSGMVFNLCFITSRRSGTNSFQNVPVAI